LTGAVSQHIGAPATVLAQGIIGLVVALAFTKFLTKKGEKVFSKDVDMDMTEDIIVEH
jgi:hypothetical protein